MSQVPLYYLDMDTGRAAGYGRETAMAAFRHELAAGNRRLRFLYSIFPATCGGTRAGTSSARLIAWVSLSPSACGRIRAYTP